MNSIAVRKLSVIALGTLAFAVGTVWTMKTARAASSANMPNDSNEDIGSTNSNSQDPGNGYYYTDLTDGNIGTTPAGYVPNDDSSFGPYPLGFSLTYFGQTYNSFYINNNGNISFGSGVSTYTPQPLNTTDVAPIIAPYWADVDTRSIGNVTLRTDIPDEVIVTWDQVGYYAEHADKTASFQLVLRGPNYPVPSDEGTVGFFYKNVQWETGDASGGNNGFGGTEAAVGFGDGSPTNNPGEYSLPGSQQPGISKLVNNNHLWFKLDTSVGGTIPGTTQTNPVPASSNPIPGLYTYIGASSGTWIDPTGASSFEYSMLSPGSLFTKILNFPTGFSSPFTVSVGDRSLGDFGPGDSVDFVSLIGSGVSSFTITGINSSNDTPFPLQLEFNTPTADLQVQQLQAEAASVPEPSLLWGLLIFGMLGAGSRLKWRRYLESHKILDLNN